MFDANGSRRLSELRNRVINVARTETQTEQITKRFEALFREHCDASSALFLFDQERTSLPSNIKFANDRPGYALLCDFSWVTPESLQRRRSTPGVDDLREFLNDFSLGLVVTSPRGSLTPSLILALGTKISHRPFTYPEVQHIQNLAELMDNILTHSHLTAQAALKAKMEHLALMSRGLAHDLKNFITPISTFIMHAEANVKSNSEESEVHRAAKQSLHFMNDYIREALFFANRLKPNFARIGLREIFETTRELTAIRAARREVAVVVECADSLSITADGVLIQRLLSNLVNNAIDASSPGTHVLLRCLSADARTVRIEVTDQGCGISEENLNRIFEPYFTTKQFGDEVRGFGLGLAICEKIIHLHQGKIAVRSEVKQGTSVFVELPTMLSAFESSTAVVALAQACP